MANNTHNQNISFDSSFGVSDWGERILAQNVAVSNDTRSTGLNNNDLIVGPTGSGKTRNYVKPNLLQMNESYVVTDTKGNLVREVGPVLVEYGYDVLNIDLTDPASDYGYNPLDFIRIDENAGRPREQDIVTVASALCPIENRMEPFWDYAAQMYLSALIAYVVECLPEEEHTLESVGELVSEISTGAVDQLMQEQYAANPDSCAAKRYRRFSAMAAAEKMNASIIGIMAEKLDSLLFDGVCAMYKAPERIDFRRLGQRKTALFLTVSDVDRSLDRLANLFYTQALESLIAYADDECPGQALPVPVRLILDDFATNCTIADFDKVISVIRSRNIAVSIVLQSLTQLDAMYGEACSDTIVNGCDHVLYLGGRDRKTAQYVGVSANVLEGTVLKLPKGNAYLLETGSEGVEVRKYRLEDHARYCELPEVSDWVDDVEAALGL